MSELTPIFAFDIDGVVLKWFSRLPDFLDSKGIDSTIIRSKINSDEYLEPTEIFQCDEEQAQTLLREYNASHYISRLDEFDPKTASALRKFSEMGEVVAVTCIGTLPKCKELRSENLYWLFGETFSQVICLDVDESKEEALRELNKDGMVQFFVDDRLRHVKEAMAAGVKAFHFVNDQNIAETEGVDQFKNWKMINGFAKQLAHNLARMAA
ncbi:conserved hypothetical protein [Vibrio chagasii]|nr:conserved hypothetical protein [Vibrio chagasii]